MSTDSSKTKKLYQYMFAIGILLFILIVPACLYINSLANEALTISNSHIASYQKVEASTPLEIKLQVELLKTSVILHKNLKFTKSLGLSFVALFLIFGGTVLVLLSKLNVNKKQ